MTKLKNKNIWITGASSGVGEGMATVFHREGANVILSGRRADELVRVAADCNEGPGSVTVLPFDIVDAAGREAAVAKVLKDFDRLDVLVNNAGIGQHSLAKETTLEVDRRIMEVDFFGPIALSKLVLPRMIEQQSGHMIVTSSVAGKHAVPLHTTYCAAKHALHGWYDTLRVEHFADNIDVTLLVIAGIRSNVFKHALTGDGSEANDNRWGEDGVGMTAEACAQRVVETILNPEEEVVIGIPEARYAMDMRQKDPEGFTERMVKFMQWQLQ